MANAVRVQQTIVSRNTSIIPQQPCSAAVPPLSAWAMEAEPMPASLVNVPLAIPICSAFEVISPTIPPPMARGANAPENMLLTAAERLFLHIKSSAVQPSI